MRSFIACLGYSLIVGLCLTAWKHTQPRHLRIHQFIIRSGTDLSVSIEDMLQAAIALSTSNQAGALREHYAHVRIRWKTIEPLAEYADPTHVTWFINGAPLPRLDQKSQFIEELQPVGLQVLDEILAESDSVVLTEKERIVELLRSLRTGTAEMCSVLRSMRWSERMQIEACRSGIMRITALGLSGFDRPSGNVTFCDEATALSTIGFILEGFQEPLSQRNHSPLADTVSAVLSRGVTMLNNVNSPDELDRMEIIRNVLNPLYGLTLRVQDALEIEHADEVHSSDVPLNPRGQYLFDSHVLNPYMWTGLYKNSVTPDLIELGALLFFDPVLSADVNRSCASCHMPELAFTDGRAKSLARDGNGSVTRNAPTLLNAVFARRFFYDLRAERLSEVIDHVVHDPKEFGFSLLEAVARLRTSEEYETRFRTVFNEDAPITPANISLAITAYVGTLVGFNSPVDRYLRGENIQLNPAVRRGFNTFMGRAACGTCHFAPTFAGYVPPAFTESESEVLGVPMSVDTSHAILDPDVGRFGGALRDGAEIYRHSFKTPTIRNVALTAPYMHNGAYPTLNDVLKFYDLGGGLGIGTNPTHQTLASDRLHFTEQDYADLIAFMEALTDTAVNVRKPTKLPAIPGIPQSRKIGGEY